MPHPVLLAPIALASLLAACGGGAGREPPPKPEETVFGDLVTAPGKVQDRTDAALDARREALEQRLEADEGGGNGD